MLLIKIGTKIKIHTYLSNGIKIFAKKGNKWYCFKFNNFETSMLKYAIHLLELHKKESNEP